MSNEIIILSDSDNESDSTVIDDDISSFLNKYRTKNDDSKSQQKVKTLEAIKSSDDDTNDIDNLQTLTEKLKTKYDFLFSETSTSTNNYSENANSPKKLDLENIIESVSSNKNTELQSKNNKTKTNENKALKKLEKEQEKIRKQEERERVKAEIARAKEEKKKLASAYKNIKPDECLKLLTVIIDCDLMSTDYSTDIPNVLQSANVTYKIASNLLPFTIFWNRKLVEPEQLTNKNEELDLNNSEESCDDVLLVINWSCFVNLVHNRSLSSSLKDKAEMLFNKKIHLGIYGLKDYIRFHKSHKQKLSAKEKLYQEAHKVSFQDVESALIEIQILLNISYRFLETPEDLSAMVLQFSKSIAQIPYKLKKQQKYENMEWYIAGDNKDSVKVDKNGNGLLRLWHQQITQLPLARLELAEAVVSKYPSPSALFQAYADCTTIKEAENLLASISIRRAAGPLTTDRKIGPEFSKKMYHLFTSVEENQQI